MFKGFYNLTSGMLSQGRRLDIVANNITNITTAGYKSDRYTDSTFRDVLINRVGNKSRKVEERLGNQSYILAPSQLYTDFTEGLLEDTDLPLDFAIRGDGFFAIEQDGGTAYTRSGSFSIDDEGYLTLSGQGRVLSNNGQPIYLYTDKVNADGSGNLYTEAGEYIDTLGVYTFADNGALERNPRGLFVGDGATVSTDHMIYQKKLERSNVSMVDEMVLMMSTQRALQSAAQMSKIYDQVITKATNDIGKM